MHSKNAMEPATVAKCLEMEAHTWPFHCLAFTINAQRSLVKAMRSLLGP